MQSKFLCTSNPRTDLPLTTSVKMADECGSLPWTGCVFQGAPLNVTRSGQP